jgi:hypothetical protein
MMKQILGAGIILAVLLAGVRYAPAHSTYTGRTMKSGTSGCGSCHSGANASVSVTIGGADTLVAGGTGTYTVVLSGGAGSSVCANIACSAGTLAAADNAMKLSGGELITNGVKKYAGGSYTYSFKLTAPAAAQTLTLYATGMSTQSAWNFAPNKRVVVVAPTTGSANDESPAPGAASLGSFPEPFHGTTIVRWTLPDYAEVRVAVYDITGRRVVLIYDAPQQAGVHETPWTPVSLENGMYFCNLTARYNNGSVSNVTRKLTFLR